MSVKKPIFGLIGDGRLARHLARYFALLDLPLRRWSRRLAPNLPELNPLGWQSALKDCDTLLLAVSDTSIEPLATQIRSTSGFEARTLIHFSGSLFTKEAWSFHPLMTFPVVSDSNSFYSLERYRQIPFLIDEAGPSFSDVFPDLPNPSSRLSREKKALYHAWCVMGGNFTAFLWTEMFEAFSKDLGINPKVATPYLRQVAENLLTDPEHANETWTGPIIRKDFETIDRHLSALSSHPYKDIYRAFLNIYLSSYPGSTS
jgi:predicted short-subunit dehydrogenase-like oxidoreductase (DUF2520 family)